MPISSKRLARSMSERSMSSAIPTRRGTSTSQGKRASFIRRRSERGSAATAIVSARRRASIAKSSATSVSPPLSLVGRA